MGEEKIKPAVEETFTRYLEQKQKRKTPERYAILRRVLAMDKHFFIDTLYSAMEEAGYRVSRATVYNTVELLVEAGIVRCHRFNNRTAQFELIADSVTANHQHLVCLKCGKVKELKDLQLARTLSERRYQGFTPEYSDVYIYGICSQCRRKQRTPSNTRKSNIKPLK